MRLWLGTALALSLFAAAASAQEHTAQLQSQSGPPDETARPLFEDGRRAYEAGRYAEALDAFQRVFVSTGHPAMLINIANAHAKLGESKRAAASLEQYLALVPDAPDRLVLEGRIAQLYDQPDTVVLAEAPPAPPLAPAPVPAELAPPPPAASIVVARPASDSRGLLLGRTFTWLALGSSAVFAGVAGWVWIDANQRYERLALTCGTSGSCTDAQLNPIQSSVTVTNLCLAGSALSLVAAGILFVVEAEQGRPETAARVHANINVDAHGALLGVSGRL
jgi:tetratricopeptide (TPR) repeat protein